MDLEFDEDEQDIEKSQQESQKWNGSPRFKESSTDNH